MITFETDVHIERPLEEVFAYVSEPLNFPRWNSAVEVVRVTSAREGGVGSSYVMERELPTGREINRLDVVASEAPREFAIRASAGPTLFLPLPVRLGERRNNREAGRRGRAPRRGRLPAAARPARHQERCGRQPRDVETHPRTRWSLIAQSRRSSRRSRGRTAACR
jgi:Polyketide cyclase / dehydrase and lipid transport